MQAELPAAQEQLDSLFTKLKELQVCYVLQFFARALLAMPFVCSCLSLHFPSTVCLFIFLPLSVGVFFRTTHLLYDCLSASPPPPHTQLAISTQQPDYAGARVADCLTRVAALELLEAPGLAFSLPREYAALPHLAGRARVEVTVEKADGSAAFVDPAKGGLTPRGKVLSHVTCMNVCKTLCVAACALIS